MKITNQIITTVLLLVVTSVCFGQNVILKADQMLNVKTGNLISPAVIVIENGIIIGINPK